jgi:hypothetical protein
MSTTTESYLLTNMSDTRSNDTKARSLEAEESMGLTVDVLRRVNDPNYSNSNNDELDDNAKNYNYNEGEVDYDKDSYDEEDNKGNNNEMYNDKNSDQVVTNTSSVYNDMENRRNREIIEKLRTENANLLMRVDDSQKENTRLQQELNYRENKIRGLESDLAEKDSLIVSYKKKIYEETKSKSSMLLSMNNNNDDVSFPKAGADNLKGPRSLSSKPGSVTLNAEMKAQSRKLLNMARGSHIDMPQKFINALKGQYGLDAFNQAFEAIQTMLDEKKKAKKDVYKQNEVFKPPNPVSVFIGSTVTKDTEPIIGSSGQVLGSSNYDDENSNISERKKSVDYKSDAVVTRQSAARNKRRKTTK